LLGPSVVPGAPAQDARPRPVDDLHQPETVLRERPFAVQDLIDDSREEAGVAAPEEERGEPARRHLEGAVGGLPPRRLARHPRALEEREPSRELERDRVFPLAELQGLEEALAGGPDGEEPHHHAEGPHVVEVDEAEDRAGRPARVLLAGPERDREALPVDEGPPLSREETGALDERSDG